MQYLRGFMTTPKDESRFEQWWKDKWAGFAPVDVLTRAQKDAWNASGRAFAEELVKELEANKVPVPDRGFSSWNNSIDGCIDLIRNRGESV
jgi:hypothetical protein